MYNYPHEIDWNERFPLISVGEVIEFQSKLYVVKQVLPVLIPGDTPKLVLEPKDEG